MTPTVIGKGQVARVAELFHAVGIPDPQGAVERRIRTSCPGGMKQRVMIAMAWLDVRHW